MKKSIIILLVLFFSNSCDVLESPPNDNVLDPESPNYINARPVELTVTTIDDNTVQLWWEYFSNNHEGFRVQVSTDGQLNNKVLIPKPPQKRIDISGLDTSKTYTFRVQAFYKDISSIYSEPIHIDFSNFPSYSLSKNIIPVYKNINDFTWDMNSTYLAIVDNGIEILGVNLRYKKLLFIPSSSTEFFFSNDDDYFIVINSQSYLELWDTKTWNQDSTLNSIAVEKYTPNYSNNTIAVSNSNTLHILQIPEGQIIKSISLTNNVSSLRFSDDGLFLIIGTVSGEVKLFGTTNLDEKKSFFSGNSSNSILSVDISSANRYLLYTFDKNLEIIDLHNDNIIRHYISPNNNPIINALFTSNPDVIVLATGNKTIQIYASTTEFSNTIFTSNDVINKLGRVDRTNNIFSSSGTPFTKFKFNFNGIGSWQVVN